LRHSLTRRFGKISKRLGLAMTALALMGQLAVGAMAPMQMRMQARTQVTALEKALVLCLADTPANAPPHTPLHHHNDCQLCPLCQAMAHSAAIITPAPIIPVPRAVLLAQTTTLRTPRGPPPPLLTSASPRGPPIPA
jgi:hypothetical protein